MVLKTHRRRGEEVAGARVVQTVLMVVAKRLLHSDVLYVNNECNGQRKGRGRGKAFAWTAPHAHTNVGASRQERYRLLTL